MTENQIKEHLSRDFIRLIAHRSGFGVDVPETDYGSDALLTHYERIRTAEGTDSWSPSGQCMDTQLKCTTEKSIVRKNENIEYKLRVKNYNDLVRRQEKAGAVIPLFLVLFILPVDVNIWLSAEPEKLLLSGQGYWYMPPLDAKISNLKANSKLTISIPQTNLIGLNSVHQLFQELFS